MLWAVAFTWEDFPRYDRIEQKIKNGAIEIIYYWKDAKVFDEQTNNNYLVIRNRYIGLRFIEATDLKEATTKIIEEFDKHILGFCVSSVPERVQCPCITCDAKKDCCCAKYFAWEDSL